MVVGNKADLEADREVKPEDGERVAKVCAHEWRLFFLFVFFSLC